MLKIILVIQGQCSRDRRVHLKLPFTIYFVAVYFKMVSVKDYVNNHFGFCSLMSALLLIKDTKQEYLYFLLVPLYVSLRRKMGNKKEKEKEQQ